MTPMSRAGDDAGRIARPLRAALAGAGGHPCRIDARTFLAGMHAQHGFVRGGADFAGDGVPHMPMPRPGSGLAGLP